MTTTKPVRVRFAPSPTGKLHIGGARTAIYNWAFARATGGTFVLRIEDTDPERSTEENTQIILRALRWMGLDWDEGPEVGGPCGPYFQTQRTDTYEAALQKLIDAGAAYPCFCTKEELDAKREAAEKTEGGYAGYDRTCRAIPADEAAARVAAGEPHVWRLKVPDDHGPVTFKDAVYGDMSFPIDVMDDMILRRTDGTFTYNFAVVCDDVNMGITHVIRGDDHLSNTPRQVMVYEALGAPVPVFAHISMILGADGKKLSKRHGATSVEEFRDEGYLPDAFVNYLALLGWSPDGETTIVPRDVLASTFSLDRVSKNPATFDPAKLDWINAEYLAAMSDEQFTDTVMVPELVEAGLMAEGKRSRAWLTTLASVVRPRTKHLGDVPGICSMVFATADTLAYEDKAVSKGLAKEGMAAVLDAATSALHAVSEDGWNATSIDEALEALPEQLDVKKRLVFQAIRAAVCGNLVSPPLGVVIELVGKEDALARIERAKGMAL